MEGTGQSLAPFSPVSHPLLQDLSPTALTMASVSEAITGVFWSHLCPPSRNMALDSGHASTARNV